MSSAVFIVFCVVLSIEDFLICIGNTFTIYVFWKKRRTLRKASYLLINLAVADLLVGVLQITLLATQIQLYLFNFSEINIHIFSSQYTNCICVFFDVFTRRNFIETCLCCCVASLPPKRSLSHVQYRQTDTV